MDTRTITLILLTLVIFVFMAGIGILTSSMIIDKQGIDSFDTDSYDALVQNYYQLKESEYAVYISYTNNQGENFCTLYEDDYYYNNLIKNNLEKLQDKYPANGTIEIYIDENSHYCKSHTDKDYNFIFYIIGVSMLSVACFILIVLWFISLTPPNQFNL